MPLLSNSELAQITSDIREVIGDSSICTTITFHLSGSTVNTWSPTAQLMPSMYALSSVSAFKGSYNLYEIQQSGGLLEYGDVKFIIMSDDVSGVLSTIDKISEAATNYQSATTYEIRTINKDPLDICYFFGVRAL